ncbi:hypothetical protein SUGI_0358880 [Cryptomeria japonica]|nr:hypothetical protein SUGI_0358880 [Cryptomeria japonica]
MLHIPQWRRSCSAGSGFRIVAEKQPYGHFLLGLAFWHQRWWEHSLNATDGSGNGGIIVDSGRGSKARATRLCVMPVFGTKD